MPDDIKPLPYQMFTYINSGLETGSFRWICNQILDSLIQENAFENVICEMAAMF